MRIIQATRGEDIEILGSLNIFRLACLRNVHKRQINDRIY